MNSNLNKLERYDEYINGNAMEYGTGDGYTHQDIEAADTALLWNEENYRYPQIKMSMEMES